MRRCQSPNNGRVDVFLPDQPADDQIQGYFVRLLLFVLFVVIPILEIATFIQVGSLIGLLPTLFSILLTAVIGAFLVRQQGFKVLNEAREQGARNEVPVTAVIHGVFVLAAGLLLLTPGFVTDTIGFLFLIPPVRLLIAGKVWSWISANMDVKVMHGARFGHTAGHTGGQDRGRPDGMVIDAEAEDITDMDDKTRPRNTGSPWSDINRH